MRPAPGGARFRQSTQDFPLSVLLGGTGRRFRPGFALERWAGRGRLEVQAAEEGGGRVRGDGRRLEWRGRERTHRWTILGDAGFEYDVILHRPPPEPYVDLDLSWSGELDFYRQPDFLPEESLAGSYAVYARAGGGDLGTGKLCHIYRPRIFDARGRSVWGALEVAGKRLRVLIPEEFLAEAAYPVVVDPVIGTQSVGANTHWVREAGGDPERLYFETQMPVNRYQAAESFGGTCTAYFYSYFADSEAAGKPILYADGGNYPTTRRSRSEASVSLHVPAGQGAAWKATTFTLDQNVAAGTYLWFGFFAESFMYPVFDYGARLYGDFYAQAGTPPATYPLYSVNDYYDLKLSMYFDYTPAQNHSRTLTATVGGGAAAIRHLGYGRRVAESAAAADAAERVIGLGRRVAGNAEAADAAGSSLGLGRQVVGNAEAGDVVRRAATYLRSASELVAAAATPLRRLALAVRVAVVSLVRDYLGARLLVSKETLDLSSRITRIREFISRL